MKILIEQDAEIQKKQKEFLDKVQKLPEGENKQMLTAMFNDLVSGSQQQQPAQQQAAPQQQSPFNKTLSPEQKQAFIQATQQPAQQQASQSNLTPAQQQALNKKQSGQQLNRAEGATLNTIPKDTIKPAQQQTAQGFSMQPSAGDNVGQGPTQQAAPQQANKFSVPPPEEFLGQQQEPVVQTSPTQAAPKASGGQSSGGIVDYLKSIGQPSDKESRKKLADQYGVQGYDFSAQKNTELLNKLKQGAQQQGAQQQGAQQQGAQQQGAQQQGGGISQAVGDAGNVVKKALIGTDQPLGGAAGAVSKGIGAVGNVAQGAATGASKAIGAAGNVAKKALIGTDQPLGGAAGAVSKGIGAVGNVAKNAGNVAKGAVSGASKAAGAVGNVAKQGITGQKEPMGGLLGGISKGIGAVGNVAKKAVGMGSDEEENNEEKFQYFGLNKATVQEKNNISRFLRHLSEKNYSSAHKYLKAIVESKVKRNILQRIGKI